MKMFPMLGRDCHSYVRRQEHSLILLPSVKWLHYTLQYSSYAASITIPMKQMIGSILSDPVPLIEPVASFPSSSIMHHMHFAAPFR